MDGFRECACGGEVDVFEDYPDFWYVECRNCGRIYFKPQNADESVEEWWNRRAFDGTS